MNILKSKFNDISNKDLYIVTFLSAISFLLTIIFSKDFFIRDISYEKYIYIYAIAELLCFIIITLFWTGFVFIIKSLKNGNERVKSFVKYFIPYFILMLVVLIFTYPGIFKGDEFYLIQSAIKLKFQYTQHYFTDLFYIICLMIYPAMATITLVQVFIISTIISKTMQEAETLFNNKKLVWIFYIPLLFLPVIDNNLFPLRNSIITYLFLRTILRIWICIKEEVTTWKNWMEIFILTAIISAIKTEFIYLILIVPITFKVISNTDWTKTLIICLSIILAVKIINIPQHDNKNNTYVLTTLFNPLSMIISSDNVRGINGNDVKTINQVTNYEILKNHASFLNIPVYFSSYTNKKIKKNIKMKFELTCLKLFICNFDTYIINRIKTFIYTSGMKKDYINHTGHENSDWTLKLDYNKGIITKMYMKNNEPLLGYEVRKHVISFITCRNPNNYTQTNLLYHITYNVLPQIVGLIVLFLYSFRKKIKNSRNIRLIILITLLQFPIIFLTAPAAFWMYYMPLYMSGNMIITFTLLKYLDNKGEEKNEHNNNYGGTRNKI